MFFSHITEQRPFVHLKYAQTLDGKMSTLNGDSKWITSQESRLHVHKQRALYDSILVGANTALKDDPKLTIRLDKPEYSTKRIILTNKKIENTSLNLLKDNFKSQTIQLIKDPTQDLSSTLQNLYENHDIKSIYVEGGAKTIELFLKENLFDKITVYIAPKILGQGTSPLAKENLTEISNSYMFQNISWEIIEDNVVMTAYRKKTCLQG